MDKKTRYKITGIGPVIFGKVTINKIANAQEASKQLELPERARIFTNHVISGAVIKPKLSPSEVSLLPDIVINELASCVVSLLQIEKYYTAVEEDDVHLKFYRAFHNYESELFGEIINHLKPLLVPVSFQISSVVGSMFNRMAAHREKFRQTHERLETLSAKWRASLASIEKLNLTGLFKDFTIQVTPQKEAADAFRAAGWPIAPSMPEELRERVVEMHKQGNTRYISRTIMGYYGRDQKAKLKAMVEGWSANPLFMPRMKIIRDALWAHCEGLYTLSSPAVVPNIEGIMRSYVYAKGLTGNGKNPKMPEIYNAFTDEYDLSNWLIAEVFLYQLESNIYSYKSFDNELKKTITSRFVNRHTMLHGIAFNYDREIHSLKAFLLLDAVSALPV
jgi:hypothetical protein